MTRPPSLVERYHQATRYTPENVGRGPGLDFQRQPSPFKSWYEATRTPLPGGPAEPPAPRRGPLDAERLGRLLYHTYGVTLVREFPGMSMHFRAAPSAGALYPTELYVAVRGIQGIADGLYDYLAKDHALALCWEGDFHRELEGYAFGHPAVAHARAVLVLTGVYERSTWRYRDRAYRRVLLDAGHVLGNAVLVAPQDGQRVVPVPGFHDGGMDGLLLLDGEREGTLLLAPVVDESDVPAPQALPASPLHRDDPSPEEGAWIPAVHRAGRIDEPRVAPPDGAHVPALPPLGPPIPLEARPLPGGAAVLEAIRVRRSARRFRPSPVPLEAVGRILAHAHPRPGSGDPVAEVAPPNVLDVWVVAATVQGLEPGVYRYDAAGHALVPTRRGDPRRALHHACLLQDLARDCAFTVVHTFDLPWAVERYGERAYRYAHLEAGLLGQRMGLAALRLGFGASGIGGFFDELVGQMLQLPPEHATAYLTTIGVPA